MSSAASRADPDIKLIDLYALRRERGGIVYDGGRRWLGPGPGHSNRDSSLSVRVTDDGRVLVKSFAGDDFRDCLNYVGADPASAGRLNKAGYAKMKAELESEQRARRDAQRAHCDRVWRATLEAAGSPVEHYLASRGLLLPPGDVVRFHPAAPLAYQGGRTAPSMVSLLQDRDGGAVGLHVTTLATPRKKLMFGMCAGSAVRLAPFCGGDLAVAEGIETALSFAAMNDLATWACLSTSGLQSFNLPRGVRRLLIAADSDDHGAGMEAARRLANRVTDRCDALILPAPAGCDWNDVHQQVRP